MRPFGFLVPVSQPVAYLLTRLRVANIFASHLGNWGKQKALNKQP